MLTSNHVNNEVIKFRRQVISDFLRRSRFDPFMGDSSTNVIVRLADLESDGKQVNIPLVNQMSGDGVGAGTLRGNEEMLDSYGFPIWADWARNAVANNRASNKESSFNVRSTARDLLRGWGRRIVRDDLTDALLSIPTASVQANRFGVPGNRVNGIKWSAATPTQKDNWMNANYDRVQFGTVAASAVPSTFAAAALLLDTTADIMTAAVGSLAKQKAKQSGVSSANPGVYNGRPKITPWEIEELDEEMFVCFLGDGAFRSLQNDPVMYQANRDARNRDGTPEKYNPIFTGGALLFDGVLYKNIPEITQRLNLGAIGTASANVEPFFLCGQAALAYATGQMPRPTQLEDGDYDFVTGLGIEAQYGVGKIAKAPLTVSGATVGDLVDWGMVTGFVATT
ncbi:phage capsid family protein [Bradyrhizobium diazoefficiens]|uniref:phage capsid family protein n=1 Tax=Bradyrhizobium diazoefficiens TaxID=1355477 RepID=UPI0027146F45|nr:DUF4043 family protein [Bradyrhizobium diazoefficiens]WLB34866.1 DUF4043 family protein [Bradyrhizobium diazoefficiens]BCF44600.1 hypothetical protein XF16B_50900 [Bradyrhizobium diazoefficiens]BCF70746.1 hypothetical protein XF19B_50990 [Bradyrhizobium diazoefficiens]